MSSQAEEVGQEKNTVTLTIISDGNTYTDTFNIHEKIRKVIHDALKAFNIDVSQVPNYVLRYGNQNLDDLERSIKDYGVQNNAELFLAPRRVGAG